MNASDIFKEVLIFQNRLNLGTQLVLSVWAQQPRPSLDGHRPDQCLAVGQQHDSLSSLSLAHGSSKDQPEHGPTLQQGVCAGAGRECRD